MKALPFPLPPLAFVAHTPTSQAGFTVSATYPAKASCGATLTVFGLSLSGQHGASRIGYAKQFTPEGMKVSFTVTRRRKLADSPQRRLAPVSAVT